MMLINFTFIMITFPYYDYDIFIALLISKIFVYIVFLNYELFI